MRKISIIIVDDHLLFSQGLRVLISDMKEFEVIKVFNNGKKLINYLNSGEKPPDIVLMDINMPIMNGIETTRRLKISYPSIKVLALSIENGDSTVLQMIRAGAKGYLLKDIHPHSLKQGLLDVFRKGFYFTDSVTYRLLNLTTPEKISNKALLKEREMEFLNLACTDLTYNKIAEKMFLSPKTIDGYRGSLFSKFKVKNRIGLVLYAIKEKIVNV